MIIESEASSRSGVVAPPVIRPHTLNLQAIDVCNSRCIMCNIWKDGRREKMGIDQLRAELLNPFYSEVRHVGVTGGEPTLRRDLYELYDLFPQVLPKFTGGSFITHGMQTGRAVEVYSKVHARYRGLGLTFDGMVSLDGVGAVHDLVRGRKGAFDAATESLLQLKDRGVGVIAACTIVRANVYGMHDLLEWGKANGVYVRFRVAEFIRRLYNSSCSSEIRAFDPRELRHLVSFLHVLLGEYETSETIRKTYTSILSLLTGGERLIGCPYQKGIAVNVDSRGWLASCAPKGTSFEPSLDPVETHSHLAAQRLEVAKNDCANCIHDYHDDWSATAAKEIAHSRMRSSELYDVPEAQLTTNEVPDQVLDLTDMKQVLLAGWYGTETAGDIAILRGIIAEYLVRNPRLRFQVLSLYPYYTRTTVALWPDELRAKVSVIDYASDGAWQAALDCDAIMMAGGPLMDIAETRKILCLFKRFADLGKPRVIEGCGVGPLNRPEFRWNVCRIARLATTISVRDHASREALRSYGIRKEVTVRMDPAVTFLRGLGVRHHGSDGKVIRCFLRELTCEYPQALTPDQAFLNLVEVLKRILAWYPQHRIELWAMHHFPVGNDDRLFVRKLEKQIADPRLVVEWEPRSPEEIVAAMAGAEFCVCMRFHSCVFASEVGVPFMAVDYTAGGKIKAFLDDIQQADRLVRLGDLPALGKADFQAKLRFSGARSIAKPVRPDGVAAKKAPTVLHIIQNVIGGGGSRAMISLAKHSRRLGGYDHRLVSLAAADIVGLELAKQAGLSVLDQPSREELHTAIAEADVVLVHWWNNPDLATLFRSDLPAARLALWLHVGGYHSPQVLSRPLIDFADLAVACSPHTYAHPVFAGLAEETRLERTAMVLAGADFDRLKGVTPRVHAGFRVGYIGTVDPVKMHADFVSMSSAVEVPGVSFVVCGNGDTRWLSGEAEKRGRSSSFDFRGPVEDIRSVIETLDVYGYPLCPDTYAAAELNLQEVMFAGLPVVAFPYGGIAKLIQHGETGILVDTAEEYARAIEELHRNPAERARLGANAAAFARSHWGAESSAREFNAHFERLLASPKRTRRWGVSDDAPPGQLPVSLADRVDQLAIHPGARMFVESLDADAQIFIDSLTGTSFKAIVDAEDRIARLPRMVHSTGVRSFRNAHPKDPLLQLWAGLGFLHEGNVSEAFNAFTQAWERGVEQWRIHWYRALAADRSGRPAEAVGALQLLLQAAPGFAPAREMMKRLKGAGYVEQPASNSDAPSDAAQRYVQQAERLLQGGQVAQARDWLERALDLVPGQPELMEAITELDCRLGNLDAARKRFLILLASDPRRTSPRMDRIREALGLKTDAKKETKAPASPQWESILSVAGKAVEHGDYPAAIEALERARALTPGNPEVLIALGNLHLLGGNNQAAFEAVQASIAASADDPTAHVLLAQAAVRLDRVGEFEAALGRALEIDAAFAPAHRLLGDLMMEGRNFTEAARHYRTALNQSEADVGAHLALATCLHRSGDPAAAAAALDQALQIARADSSRREALGFVKAIGSSAQADRGSVPGPATGGLEEHLVRLEAALNAKDNEAAEAILSAAFKAYPENGELVQALANLQFQMGRFAQAIPSFKAAGRLAPQDPLIPVLLAHCHLNIEDVEGFEAAVARSFEIQPGNSHALRLVGDVNFRFGRHADAARAYGALVNQGESDVEVMLGLGRCFEEIGQLPGAHACFTEVIRRQPAHSEANRLLAALEQRIHRAGAPVPVHQNQADHEQVPCPACGSRVANAVRTRADIVQCGGCQTVYLRTRMTKEAMRRLYQSYADDGSHMALPKSIEEAEKSGLARNYFLKEILTFIEPSGEFLDVGCGWGGFLLNARKHGFKPRGIELTRRCVGYARDSLKIPVVETQLEETDVTPGSLSVVTMNHVLEHLPEPAKALGKVIDSLKAGGMYCGIVPNFQSACSTSEGENWYWLDPFYHYTHFTPATLRRFLEAAGFIVERLYTATGDYGAENVRKGCLKADAKLADDDYFKAEVQRYEAEGRGEEIRFFARKPSLVKTTPAPAIVGGQGITVPVVSVIVSTYNSEKFIRPCLENLTRQTLFPQVEVIVVDSGSDQNEGAIVAEFATKHPNIRYVRTERETLYGAWNRGLALARGRYWVNANTDDALRDDALEMLVKAMDANASAQIAYSDCVWTSTPNDTFPSKTLLREVRYPDYVPIHSLFYCITGCLQFWRAADLRAMGGFDASLKAAGDYEIMTRLLQRGGSALHVGELLSLFFQNTRGISQADDRSDKEHAAVTASLRKDLDISRVFQCRPEVPNDQALAWTALAISALHFTVPWEDKPFSQHEYSLVCLEKAVQADENCSEAWQTLAGFVTQIGQASEFEGRLKGRWPQVVGHLRRAREGVAYVIPELAHAIAGPSFEVASSAAEIPGLELEPAEIRPWVSRREGRFSYLSHKLIPRSKGVTYTPSELKEAGVRLFAVLEKFPAFCAHFGGAGDGLLLMAATFDRDPKMPVVSYPNSHRSAVAFFDAFPAGGQVYLLPLSGDPQVHIILRWVMKGLRTCTNAGATPKDGYADEWKPCLDIAKKYGINLAAKWAAAFINNTNSRRIAIAPKGSLAGMVGSKRNIIDRSIWSLLLGHVKAAGYVPVVVGTPDEASDYPAGEGCVDARSRSFRSQMEEIGRCVGLVGADSWAKTFSALAGLATIVFEPIKGPDLKGWADPADNVFIKPWPLIRMVKDLAEFEASFDRLFPRNSAEVASSSQAVASGGGLAVSWEGSFLDLGSLSHVNRALTDLLAADRRFAFSCVGGNSIPVSMRNNPDWKRRAKALLAEPNGKAAVTVRHQWPPDWSRPAAGALVVIQPWEFGSLPKEWVAAAKDVDEFWAPSEYVRQVYIASGVDAAKVRVVPNGVDTDLYRPDAKPRALKTKKRFKLLFVGATIGRKGPDVLLQSYLATFTAADDVCLVVKDFGGDTVYTGQTIGALIEKAASQPNAPEILYLDEEIPPAEMPGLFTACDCLVHPYRGEGFGMPILEAMACGLPVVVTKGGAADDFVGEANGWLIRSQRRSIGNEVSKIPLVGDGWLLEPDASHLSAILREVVADPTLAKAKGREGALVAHKKYGWPTIAGIVANRLVEVGGRKPVGPLAGTGKRKPAMARIILPPCALLGHIGNAAELLRQNKLRPAWKAACVALDERPFNPPAWEIMGEIAAAAGDYKLAKTCLEALRAIVPGWKNVKELTRLLMGKAGGKPSGFVIPSKPDAPRISVCLIARNEERFLEQCLKSVKDLAWEIIVVDTGSTDRTIEIAKGFGARIGGFAWCDDFAAARNAAMEMVRGDWVLILDADEVVRSESLRHLKNELADAASLAWRIPLFNVGKENTGSCVVPRLFRNAPALFYVGRVHEQIFTSVEVRRQEWGMETKLGRTELLHYGYTEEMTRDRNKIERNLKLLEQAVEEIPGDANLIFNLGMEKVRMGRIEEGLVHYREAIQVLNGTPADQIVPELREVCLTQFLGILKEARKFHELAETLDLPIMSRGAITASMHYLLGFALVQLGRSGDAAKHLRACIGLRNERTLAPIHSDLLTAAPHHCLAVALANLNLPDEAEAAFDRAKAEAPLSAAVMLDYARFEAARGETAKALHLLHVVLGTDPKHSMLWRFGAQILLQKPELGEIGDQWTSEALNHFPADRELLSARGEILLLTGHANEAATLLEQAAKAGGPRLVAADAVCRLVNGGALSTPVADTETTREFLVWYRRLVQWQASGVVGALNEALPRIEVSLPKAGAVIRSVLAEAAA